MKAFLSRYAAFNFIMAFIVAGGFQTAFAHDEPYSHVDIRLESNRAYGRVVAHMVDLAHEGGLEKPELLLEHTYAEKNLATLHKVLDSHVMITINSEQIRPEWTSFEVVTDRKSLAFEWTASLPNPAARVEVLGPLFPYDPPHETYLNIYDNGIIRHQDLLDKNKTSATYYSGSTQGTIEVVREFVIQGIHHIFIGPDHILFIIGLLLLGGNVVRLLTIVTAFTIAHTVTLVLATLKALGPPASLVEPAIAFSIMYLGVETLYAFKNQRRDQRIILAFLFGLVHGFGFAGVLADFGLPSGALGWSLAAFNVGVEIGQACIVLAVAPLLAMLHSRKPTVARRVVYAATVSIIIAGTFWFVERVFFA